MFCIRIPFATPKTAPAPSLCWVRRHLQYLAGALPDCVDELLNDQIDTFETGSFQLNDLLFHDDLKRHVWSKQPRSENPRRDTDTMTDRWNS